MAAVGVLVLLGCSRSPERATAPAAPASAEPATKDDGASCTTLFVAPPSGKELCNEHVMGNGAEIHWRSYAYSEDRYALWGPYHRRASKCGASFTFKPPLLEVSKQGMRLELFDANGGGYPTCSVKPSPEHKTVVVVSEKLDRK
jgi:hypothetical protein